MDETERERVEEMLHRTSESPLPLDAEGIAVTVIDIDHRDRFGGGWPQWVLPFGGGEVRSGGITVEIRPAVDVPADRWRDHTAIQRLCARSEHMGGFMWHGDEIAIGDEILVGRDAMRFLTELAHRAQARAGDPNEAAYMQGYNDALGDALKEWRELGEKMRKFPAE